MASRDFLQHFASANEPSAATLGDEWYNTSTNRLLKRVVVSGTSVQWRELSGGVGVQQNGASVTSSTSILNFANAVITLDGTTGAVRITSTATPAGNTTEIQFNNGGALGASSSLTWNGSTLTLGVTGFVTANRANLTGGINSTSWSGAAGIGFNTAGTFTDTSGAGGTVASRVNYSFNQATMAASTATNITLPINLFVDAPAAGTNTTFTGTSYALYAQGNTRVTGLLVADTNIQQLAGFVFDSASTAVSTAGSVQADATALTNTINNVTTVGATTQGVRFPSISTAGVRIIVRNGPGTAFNVYPASGAQINQLGTNAAFTMPAAVGATIEFVAVTTTQWNTLGATYV